MKNIAWLAAGILGCSGQGDVGGGEGAESEPEALAQKTGILVLAHGTQPGHDGGHGHDGCPESMPTPWEQRVLDSVDGVKHEIAQPVEVAFGMWSTDCFQAGIERLREQEPELAVLIVVPLFISSHSAVIDMQRWIFGLAAEQPFPLPVAQVKFDGEIRYTRAIDYTPEVSGIVLDRARALVHHAAAEVDSLELKLVMHGPVAEDANHRWLATAELYAADLATLGFAEIHTLSLRDDAEGQTWDRAREELRHQVAGAAMRGRQALVLPLLLSADGIESGIHDRLEGLEYVWTGQTLLPDARIGQHVVARAIEDGGL